ncbi:MAG TPA: M56 family metallopeptidase [Thermoanaerobaculia bacterium]|jgi:beta-lactamase regulating signal transducer with metallopeptidase domain
MPANELVHHAVAWMLTYLLHSTLLLGLAWLASKPLSRWSVAAEEAVWRLALVGAILTASLQVATGWEPVAGRWRLADTSVAALNENVGAGLVPARAEASFAPTHIQPERLSRRSAPAWAPWGKGGHIGLPLRGSAATLTLGAWVLGMLALLAAHGASYLRLRRRLRPRPRVVGGTLFSQLRRLALEAGLVEDVRLTCSSRVPVPLAFQREICVPPRALAGLSDEQQEGMLAHELAHLVRRDPFWLVVGQAVSCVLFFQPLNWVARRRLREISEMLSDEWAVARTGRPLSLAGCLAEVAGWSSAGSAVRALPVPGMADRPSNLGRRIRRLLDETRSPERPARRLWLGGAMVVLVIAVAAAAPAVSAVRTESRAVEPAEPAAAAAPVEPVALAALTEPEPPSEEVDVQEAEEPEHDVDVDVNPDIDADFDFDHDFDFDSSGLDAAIGQAMASVDVALDSMDLDLEGLDDEDYHSLTPEEREKLEREIERVNRKIEETLKPRIEQLAREMSEKAVRMQTDSAEMRRLQAEMEALAERMRPSAEEMARLHAQIDEQVEKLQADGVLSRDERQEIARHAREMAERMKPTEEQRRQMEQLRQEMMKQSEEMRRRFQAENHDEMEKAHREMREEIQREMQAVREELRRTREQHRLRMQEDRREHERRKEIRKERQKEREDGDEKPPKVSVRFYPDSQVMRLLLDPVIGLFNPADPSDC